MAKLKLERVAGIVALSYLVLIPVGGIFIYIKVKQLDQDVSTLWHSTPVNGRPSSEIESPWARFKRIANSS